MSSRMCLFFRSCGSGLCCRCFSKLLRRSSPSRTGEMGVSSTTLASVMANASSEYVLGEYEAEGRQGIVCACERFL